jgi:tripartite-type tricarboxylate transporter receptor subunit TctC
VRNPSFPDIPTIQELGYHDAFVNSMILLAPKGLGGEFVECLRQAFKKAMSDPDFVKACGMVDHSIIYRSPEDTVKYLLDLDQMFGKLIQEMGLCQKK